MPQIGSIGASPSLEVLICESSEHGGISASFESRNRNFDVSTDFFDFLGNK